MMSFTTIAVAAAAETTAYGTGAPGGLLGDTALWVLLAFIVVIGVFIRFGVPGMITGSLDKRANRIADEINDARKMREEAQELLAQYQRRQREAEEEAAAIIEQAKKDAKIIAAEARDKMNEQLARRTKAAEDKIARAEAQALAEVRGRAADVAIAAARDIIRERMDQGAQNAFIDRAIADIRGKLN